MDAGTGAFVPLFPLLFPLSQLKSYPLLCMAQVKCIRQDPNEPCEGCKSKNIQCTSEYISTRPKINRTGKRIEHAKTAYGQHLPPGVTAPPPLLLHGGRPVAPPESQSPGPPSNFNGIIGMSGANSTVDLDRGLARHLVQEYFNCLHSQSDPSSRLPTLVLISVFLSSYSGVRISLSCRSFWSFLVAHLFGSAVTLQSTGIPSGKRSRTLALTRSLWRARLEKSFA